MRSASMKLEWAFRVFAAHNSNISSRLHAQCFGHYARYAAARCREAERWLICFVLRFSAIKARNTYHGTLYLRFSREYYGYDLLGRISAAMLGAIFNAMRDERTIRDDKAA